MPNLYVAGPGFNDRQRSVMSTIENAAEAIGWDVFNPFTASQRVWRGRKPAECSAAERAEVLNMNISGLHHADVLVAWLNGRFEDGRTDTGVAWEMGYYRALYASEGGFTLGYIHAPDPIPRDGVNLMLAGTMEALCYSTVELNLAMATLLNGEIDRVRRTFPPSRAPQEMIRA